MISGFITSVQTRGGENHHQAWFTTGENNVAVFKLTACIDAFVLFTPYFGQADVQTYEIGIGFDNNTKTVIKKDYVIVSVVPSVCAFQLSKGSRASRIFHG